MTEETKKEETQKPLIEDEIYPEEEPDHPGWLSIAEIMKIDHPFLNRASFSSVITTPVTSMRWQGITSPSWIRGMIIPFLMNLKY